VGKIGTLRRSFNNQDVRGLVCEQPVYNGSHHLRIRSNATRGTRPCNQIWLNNGYLAGSAEQGPLSARIDSTNGCSVPARVTAYTDSVGTGGVQPRRRKYYTGSGRLQQAAATPLHT